MTVYLSALAGAGQQFFNDSGVILSGGKLYSYAAGTTTPQATYTSASGSTAHTNPIILNSAGRVATGEIWLTATQNYKFVLYTSTNVLIASWDNISGINDTDNFVGNLANTSNPSLGDALVGFRQSNSSGNLTGSVGRTVHQKLQESVSVLDFGATGDGTTNDSVAIQAAIDAVNSNGGGTVLFPAGTYRCRSLNMKNNVKLQGTFGAVTLKLVDGFDNQVLGNQNQSVPQYKDYFGIEGIIFDGNKANSPRITGAASAVGASAVRYFYAKDCTFQNAVGYGLGLQGVPGTSINATQSQVYLENCYFLDNGDGLISGGDTFDGLDIKSSDQITLIQCYAARNKDKGLNIRGTSVTIIGGACYSNLGSGCEVTLNPNGSGVNLVASVFGTSAYSNGGGGFAVTDGGPTPGTLTAKANLTGISSYSNLYGLQLPSQSSAVQCTLSDANLFSNTSDGITVGSSTAQLVVSNCIIQNNTRDGIRNTGPANIMVSGGRINSNGGVGFNDFGSRSVLAGALEVKSNTLNNILSSGNNMIVGPGVTSYDIGTGDIIASAATITIPGTGSYFAITGTTNIDQINATQNFRGRRITLQFAGILTLNDNVGNLVLAGNFTTSSADTLSLVYDGSNWIETSRSVN
jgi:hypothetical protein